MSRKVNCFDVVSEVVEIAKEDAPSNLKFCEEDFNILEKYCAVIDEMCDEFDGFSFEAEVDEMTYEICLTLECEIFLLDNLTSPKYVQLIERSLKLTFSISKRGKLDVKFVFPSLWKKA